jgi:hypothetical protein
MMVSPPAYGAGRDDMAIEQAAGKGVTAIRPGSGIHAQSDGAADSTRILRASAVGSTPGFARWQIERSQ